MTLNDYAKEVHEANKKWWVDLSRPCQVCKGCRCNYCNNLGYLLLDRNIGEMLMLCVSELAEAMEGHRKGLMDDKLPQFKMFDVEIVDCFIRLLDLCGKFGIDLFDFSLRGKKFIDLNSLKKCGIIFGTNIGQNLLLCCDDLCVLYSSLMHKKYNNGNMIVVFERLAGLAEFTDIDLETIYQAKMTYNKSRPDHKIENRIKEGGKKY